MREIKFRGKEIATKKWVYVDLVQDLKSNGAAINGVLIDVKTLGQYTGSNDMDSREIYEGDIISDADGSVEVYYDEDLGSFMYRDYNRHYNDVFGDIWACEYKVIGNIHDNPELIKDFKL